MKKISVIFLISLILFGCENKKETVNDATSVPQYCGPEETCVNRGSTADVLDSDMNIITFDESLNYLDDTAALFYSFDDCPWCYDAIQVLNIVYKDYKIPTYYVEVKRGERAEENETYQKLIEKYANEIGDKMYIPFFVVLQNGEIVGSNTGTVEGHTKISNVLPLINNKQKEELENIYRNLYETCENK